MNTQKAVQTFQYHSYSLRIILDKEGNPLFIAKDVALALGFTNPSKAVADHCRKAKSLKTLNNNDSLLSLEINGLRSDTVLIPESDVYRLTMRSDLKSAEEFQDLVCEDILPSIRKNGSYSLSPTSPVSRVEYIRVVEENAALKVEQLSLCKMVIEYQGRLLSLPAPQMIVRGYYSHEEDMIIVESRRQGLGAVKIARKLNRTVNSVRGRMRYLERFYDTRMASNNVDMFDGEVA